MELYSIPLQSLGDTEAKFIIFRPLLGIAFIGNHQMVEITKAILDKKVNIQNAVKISSVQPFLDSIGFLRDDPAPPSLKHYQVFEPTHAILLLTNRCQMRCIYCYASGGELSPEDLAIDTAKDAIDIVFTNAKNQNKDSFNVSFQDRKSVV